MVCRASENVDLPAGVVDVVFAYDAVAGEREQVGERISDHRPAAVPHVHRTGRVGGDELDVHCPTGAERRSPIAIHLLRDDRQFISPGLVGQPKVYEARACNCRLCDLIQSGQPFRQLLGNWARLSAGEVCQYHRRVSR